MFSKKSPPQPERRRPVMQAAPPRQAVFSYHAARAQRTESAERDIFKADTDMLMARRRKRLSFWRNARMAGVTITILLLFALDMTLSTTPKVVVTGDSTSKLFLRPQSEYVAAAHQLLAGSLSNHNKLTVNTAAVSTALQRQFPELTAVSMSLPIVGGQPVIYMQPAVPRLVLRMQSSGGFVLDGSGRALIDAAHVSNLARLQLPEVTDQSTLAVHAGDAALPAADVSYITQFAAQLKAKGVAITSLVLPVGTAELDMHISGAPYLVKCNLVANDTARQQAGTLLATRAYLSAHGQTPANYIDVRVPGRVYYK